MIALISEHLDPWYRNEPLQAMIEFPCPHCRVRISAEESEAGLDALCPGCEGELTVPPATIDGDGEEGQQTGRVPPSGNASQAADCEQVDFEEERILPPLRFSFANLRTLLVCCLGFGWFLSLFAPERYFLANNPVTAGAPVLLIALAALPLAIAGILRFVRPVRFPVKSAIFTMLFTMLLGLAGLLAFQGLAESSTHWASRNLGKANGFVVILKMIGWAYHAVASENVLSRFAGFVFGVGLCEEITKTIPLLVFVFAGPPKSGLSDYRTLLVVAFFSGLGFGIGEALWGYSPWSGNSGYPSLLTRWFACVPLHGVYTVINAAILWRVAPFIRGLKGPYQMTGAMFLVVLTTAVIHGTFNTFTMIPYAGVVLDFFSIVLMYGLVVLVARAMGETGAESTALWIPSHRTLSKWFTSKSGRPTYRKAFVGSLVLVAAAIPFSSSAYDYSRSELGGRVEYESYGSGSGAQGRQKATRDAYELYMQGYRDPIQGDIAIEMNRRTGGRDSDAWALVIIGADDRRRGLPIRFELVE